LLLEFQEAIGWKYESDFRSVEVEGVDDVPVIGVLVAVSGSGKNGAADLWTTQRFADIASLPETLKARETWERFVAVGEVGRAEKDFMRIFVKGFFQALALLAMGMAFRWLLGHI